MFLVPFFSFFLPRSVRGSHLVEARFKHLTRHLAIVVALLFYCYGFRPLVKILCIILLSEREGGFGPHMLIYY